MSKKLKSCEMNKTSLGDRIKNYENVSKNYLIRKVPVIIRLDGKSFHTLTRGMEKPFDDRLIQTMQDTTQALVKNIDGCSFGYTQSDEIILLLTDYTRIETQPWFDYNVQKIVSVAASICTAYFNYYIAENINKYRHRGFDDINFPFAFFDARAFNIPREEVVNYFLWRQLDATRNSIQMLAHAHFSHKELENKSCDEIQEMLFSQKGINWNDLETHKKRGSCVYKDTVHICPKCKAVCRPTGGYPFAQLCCSACQVENVQRTNYKIDNNPPIFTQDRAYVQKWVDVDK